VVGKGGIWSRTSKRKVLDKKSKVGRRRREDSAHVRGWGRYEEKFREQLWQKRMNAYR